MGAVGETSAADTGTTAGAQLGLVVGAVFVIGVGQQSTFPILAPLARAVGLAEWQIGLMMSIAAGMLVATGTWWGKRSQAWGSKPVLIGGLAAGATALLVFAAVIGLGLEGILGTTALFVLMLMARGVLFGGALAAMMPASQTYVATVTATEQARVKGMSAIGAAQAMALLAGSALGGALALFGILTPLIVMPVVLAATAIVLARRLRPTAPEQRDAQPSRLHPFDRRILPFLLVCFGMFTALGFIQLLIGFLIADRYNYSDEVTATLSGAAGFAAGLGMLIAQAVVVPRAGWGPARLMLVGTTTTAVAFAAMVPTMPLAVVMVVNCLAGLGMGMAMPGITSGPTLAVDHEERGAATGLVTATMGLTFVVAPTLGTALYGIYAELPIVMATAMMVATVVLVILHPQFRRVSGAA